MTFVLQYDINMRKVKIKVVGRVYHWLREDRSVFTQYDFDGKPNEKGIIRGMYEKVDLDKLYDEHFGEVNVVTDSKEKVQETIVKEVPIEVIVEKEEVEKAELKEVLESVFGEIIEEVPIKEEVTFVRRRREGLSLRTEQRRRKELGMSRKSGRPEEIDWNKVKADCLVRYKEGESVVSICKAHGISVSSFYRVVLKR
jgi:hypothetical protein